MNKCVLGVLVLSLLTMSLSSSVEEENSSKASTVSQDSKKFSEAQKREELMRAAMESEEFQKAKAATEFHMKRYYSSLEKPLTELH